MFGKLEPVGGGDDIFLRKEELTVGRSERNDIVLRFKNVSGRHCKLVLSGGYWYVLDQGSTNGVKVNGLRTKDQRLDPGARVSIADHTYVVRYDPQANGAEGVLPPDVLHSDILSTSLLEQVGLSRSPRPVQKKQEPKKPEQIDFDNISIDDIEFL
ncbi:MAG: FHA domain-containing protein [Thermoguttaceae bacterium]|nr:FHA domain-containing protein [Thermoguttaceae bacterium]